MGGRVDLLRGQRIIWGNKDRQAFEPTWDVQLILLLDRLRLRAGGLQAACGHSGAQDDSPQDADKDAGKATHDGLLSEAVLQLC